MNAHPGSRSTRRLNAKNTTTRREEKVAAVVVVKE
jgi:hypothetical protein